MSGGTVTPGLTPAQITFFARNGYLQIPGIVSEGTCEYLTNETWKRLPPSWVRHDRTTWTGGVKDSCHDADLNYRRGHLKFQKGALVGDPIIAGSFGAGSAVESCALALIGRPLASIRVRGLYPNVPPPAAASLRDFTLPHVEAHPAHLVALCYLNGVGPDAGGLLVWPGSHHQLYHAFSSKLDFAATPEYDRVFSTWSKFRPIQLCGGCGDVIFTHHRLFHSPSLNKSDGIRFAFLCDYVAKDFKLHCQQKPTTALWEDWPPVRDIAEQEECDTSDQALRKWSKKDGRVDLSFSRATDATINKSEASDLARLRQPGDRWLILCDSAAKQSSNQLDPCGSNLMQDGVQVFLNGQYLQSATTNGITSRISTRGGPNHVHIVGIKKPLWLRVIEVELPFTDSRLIHQAVIAPDSPEQRIVLRDLPPLRKANSFRQANTRGVADSGFGEARFQVTLRPGEARAAGVSFDHIRDGKSAT
jgi:hypothetical protein